MKTKLQEKPKVCSLLNCISFGTLFTAVALVFTFTYWMVYPYKTLVINKPILDVVNNVVVRGDVLQYELNYCKLSDLDVTISRKFVDGIVYSTPDITTKNLKGCRKSIIGIEVPNTLPVGSYYLLVKYTYRVNPIRTVSVEAQSEMFEVVK